MAKYINLTVNQGSTFAMRFVVRDADGVAIDLTTYTLEARLARSFYQDLPYSQVLASRVIPFVATIFDAEDGEISLALSTETTRQLNPDKYVWYCDIVTIADPTIRKRVAEGTVTVTATITTYTPPEEPEE